MDTSDELPGVHAPSGAGYARTGEDWQGFGNLKDTMGFTDGAGLASLLRESDKKLVLHFDINKYDNTTRLASACIHWRLCFFFLDLALHFAHCVSSWISRCTLLTVFRPAHNDAELY